MSRHFTYRSLEDLRNDIASRNLDIRLEDNIEALFEPVAIGALRSGNRLAVHPMEGCDGTLDGRPDELTFRRWERFGAGGAKLIWGEATAVVPEARANPRQLLLTDETAPDFKRLQATARQAHRERFGRDDDLVIGLQLTHSGRWSYPQPLIARHSPTLDPLKYIEPNAHLLDDAYLQGLEDAYVRAAVLARNAGFDFVDIKRCHTYLLNELLAARDRPGPYGGSFETALALSATSPRRSAAPSATISCSRRVSTSTTARVSPTPANPSSIRASAAGVSARTASHLT
jgi:NADPH2 dehydrogenase